MKRLRYLTIAIFTFVIGVVISPIRFYPESIACGPWGSSTRYRSSYFKQASTTYDSYDCEAHASDAFNEELNDAVRVYDVSPKVNKEGVLIEQRALALFYSEGTGEYYVTALWREGKALRSIRSRSYTHVMDFERQHF